MSAGAASHLLLLSPEDHALVGRVEALARSGGAGAAPLLELLVHPSWAVRRAVTAAIAAIGEAALDGLCDLLRDRRDHEGRLAGAVDALVACAATSTQG